MLPPIVQIKVWYIENRELEVDSSEKAHRGAEIENEKKLHKLSKFSQLMSEIKTKEDFAKEMNAIENNQINQRTETNLLGVDNFVKLFKNIICLYV